jgi:hypothetical protein
MNTRCPKCNSEKTSLPQGLYSDDAPAGFQAFSTGDSVEFGEAEIVLGSPDLSAVQTAPPTKPKDERGCFVLAALLIFFFSISVIAAIGILYHLIIAFLAVSSFVVLSLCVGYFLWQQVSKKHHADLEKWKSEMAAWRLQNSRHCLDCGWSWETAN